MIESSVQLVRSHATVREAEVVFVQEEAFRTLAAGLPFALIVTDARRERVLFANCRFSELWAVPQTASVAEILEAMSRTVADPHRLHSLWHHHQEPGQDGEDQQSFLLLSNGAQLRWRTAPLLGLDEGPRGEIHLFEEIPAHRSTQERSPDDLFRLTFEKAAVGMTLISSDLRFLRANPSFCRMLGYEEKELLELRVPDLLAGEEPHVSGEWSEALSAGHESFHVTLRFEHRDSAAVWAHLSVSVVRDSDQRPVYFVALAEDITERIRKDAERERETRELLALASTDSLTGLYNHRYMVECLFRAAAFRTHAGSG
jgi:PAS domain S-box-containing protein